MKMRRRRFRCVNFGVCVGDDCAVDDDDDVDGDEPGVRRVLAVIGFP